MEKTSLPQNEEAEKAVLASLILDNTLINKALEDLDKNFFYSEKNKILFDTIYNLSKEKKPVDLVMLHDVLKNEIAPSYLIEVTSSIATSANFPHHLEILKEYHIRRQIIMESNRCITEASSNDDPSELLAVAAQNFSKLAREIKTDVIYPGDLARQGGKDFTDRLDNKIEHTGLSSGFSELDKLCGGFGKGDLIIIAGQTNIGKSAFLLDIAYRQCLKGGAACAYFSLEMGLYEIFYRLLSKMTSLESNRIKAPKYLAEGERQKAIHAIADIYNCRFFLDITPILNLTKILAKAKTIKSKESIDFVCIDYIQLISEKSKSQPRHEVLSDITKELKQLARELEIPVIAGAQLNRGTINHEEPGLNHIGESYAIVQHADTVVLISRNDTKAVLNVAKARQAKGGKTALRFDYKTVSFME